LPALSSLTSHQSDAPQLFSDFSTDILERDSPTSAIAAVKGLDHCFKIVIAITANRLVPLNFTCAVNLYNPVILATPYVLGFLVGFVRIGKSSGNVTAIFVK
jgi:hypothetical protein